MIEDGGGRQRKVWAPLTEYTKTDIDKAITDALEVLQILILGARIQQGFSSKSASMKPHPSGEPSMDRWNTCLAGCWCIKNLGSQLHIYGSQASLYGGKELISDIINLKRYQNPHESLLAGELTIIDLLDELRYIGIRKRVLDLLLSLGYRVGKMSDHDRFYHLPEAEDVELRLTEFLILNDITCQPCPKAEDYI